MRFLSVFFIIFLSNLYAFNLEYLQQIHSNSTKGEFIQNKHLKHFDQVLQSRGEFEIANGELIWSITSPIKQKSKITKDGIWIANTQNVWQKLEQNYDKELILSLLSFDFDSIKEQFDIILSGNKAQWQLNLKPKNIWLKKIFNQINISGKERIEIMSFDEANGDKTINEFKFN
jgi:hypothetical protein